MDKASQISGDNSDAHDNNIVDEALNIIDDLKSYFFRIKHSNGYFPDLSDKSKDRMSTWEEVRIDEIPFFSQGSKTVDIFIVDSSDRFYKGKSGELLIKILTAMNLTPETVFICSCDNMAEFNQIVNENKPKFIVTLGAKASTALKQTDQPLDTFRGHFFNYKGVQTMPTYHPSLLIKAPQYKRQVWEDMKQVMAAAGL